MRAEDMAQALRHLYPAADHVYGVQVEADEAGEGRIAHWGLPAPEPTPEELETALPAAQARTAAQADLTETQAVLDERYRMFNRATASGNAQDAAEIQGEIRDILAYMQEVRDAAGAA